MNSKLRLATALAGMVLAGAVAIGISRGEKVVVLPVERRKLKT